MLVRLGYIDNGLFYIKGLQQLVHSDFIMATPIFHTMERWLINFYGITRLGCASGGVIPTKTQCSDH